MRQITAFVGLGLSVLLSGHLLAQTAPPMVPTSSTVNSCTLTVTSPYTPGPPETGWVFRPTYQVASGGSVLNFPADSTPSPWRSSISAPAATYRLTGTWTKGTTTVPIPVRTYTHVCGSTPTQPPPPTAVPCAGTWSAWTGGAWSACVGGTQTRQETRTFTVTTQPANGGTACPASPETRTASQSCTVAEQPPPAGIYGVVDPDILGTCSAATHDKWVVDGGDGLKYRTWHPQTDPTGCIYAHEHGDDPGLMSGSPQADRIRTLRPVRFGYIGRRMVSDAEPNGHEEPHEGFKVFVIKRGDCNEEGRCSRQWQRSVFHMGTGGPKRFTTSHHSGEQIWLHEQWINDLFAIQLMMDTGATGRVCNPRTSAPVKDVIGLDTVAVCSKGLPSGADARLDSAYEIWSTQQDVTDATGRMIYRAFATPAVFDPITVFNPAVPSERVLATDPRVRLQFKFDQPFDTWRGCSRESYAQPGLIDNESGPSTYNTDAMGRVTAQGPLSLQQLIPNRSNGGNLRASTPVASDGANGPNHQFKLRVSYCHQRAQLGLKN